MKTKMLTLAMAVFSLVACKNEPMKPQEGYIGPSDIKVEDGRMSPEVLLSLGRLSDPQLSPDGKTILYGVSYTSIADNRSVRNLFTLPVQGGEKTQLTMDGKSISNARWSPDGDAIYFIQGGQVWKAPYKAGKLGKRTQVTDVENGVGEFTLSPDGSQLMFVSSVKSAVERPADTDPLLDKADAFATEDLMYRHWDHWVEEIDHTFIAPLANGVIKEGLDILGGADVKFQLPNGPFGGIENLCWSPDGRYIAYSCKKKTGKEYAFSTDTEIYIYCPLTGETTVIPMGGGYDTVPVWSPDGTKIAWLSMARDGYEADKVRLMVADVIYEPEGEGQTSNPTIDNILDLTAEFDYNVDAPVWAEDSKSLFFNSLVDGVQGIFNVICDPETAFFRRTAPTLWFDFGTPFGVLQDGTLLTTYCSMDFPTEIVAVKDTSIDQISFDHPAVELHAIVGGEADDLAVHETVRLHHVLHPEIVVQHAQLLAGLVADGVLRKRVEVGILQAIIVARRTELGARPAVAGGQQLFLLLLAVIIDDVKVAVQHAGFVGEVENLLLCLVHILDFIHLPLPVSQLFDLAAERHLVDVVESVAFGGHNHRVVVLQKIVVVGNVQPFVIQVCIDNILSFW